MESGTRLLYTIYSSSAVIRLSQRELLELLKAARIRNESQGLTGMLLYRDGKYLQYLEGPPESVNDLLRRLRRDDRHDRIKILRAGNVTERLFPDWSMAYKNLAGLRSATVPGYSECLQSREPGTPSGGPADSLIAMFQEPALT